MYKQANVDKLKRELLHNQMFKSIGIGRLSVKIPKKLQDYRTISALRGATAGLGAGSTLAAITAKDSDKKDWRKMLKRSLKAGAAGALVGGGVGFGMAQMRLSSTGLTNKLKNIQKLRNQVTKAEDISLAQHRLTHNQGVYGLSDKPLKLSDVVQADLVTDQNDDIVRLAKHSPGFRKILRDRGARELTGDSLVTNMKILKKQVEEELRSQGIKKTEDEVIELVQQYARQSLGSASPGAISAKSNLKKYMQEFGSRGAKHEAVSKLLSTVFGGGAAALALGLNKKKTNAKSRRNSK